MILHRAVSAVAVAAVAALATGAACSADPAPRAPSAATSTRLPNPGEPRSEHRSEPAGQVPAPLPRCVPDDLRLDVVGGGSVMSQPFADVRIATDRPRACRLRGWPDVVAVVAVAAFSGDDAGPEPGRLPLRVSRGVYERPAVHSRPVSVAAGRPAFLSVGTATAYDSPLLELQRMVVTLPHRGSRFVLDPALPAVADDGVLRVTVSPVRQHRGYVPPGQRR